jgi:hypothetical protein
MIGESFYAYPQWLPAARNPPHSRIRLDPANGDSPVFDMPFNHHYGCKVGTDRYHHDHEQPNQIHLRLIPRTKG